MRPCVVFIAAVLVALGVASSVAHARVSQEYAYPYPQVWSASVRLLRVELGYAVGEKDQETGFVLFDYADGARTFPGSIELLRVGEEHEIRVRVVVRIDAMPDYIAQMILERLSAKLRNEYGAPRAVIARPSPRPATDEPTAEETDRANAQDQRNRRTSRPRARSTFTRRDDSSPSDSRNARE